MKDVNEIQIVSVKNLDDYKISNSSNHVLIEVIDYNDYIGKDNQLVFPDLAKKISYYESAPSWGYVVKIPDELFFHPKSADSIEWETKQELMLGDKVWFQRSMYLNAPRIRAAEKEYVVMRYADIYMAARDSEIFMLNGYLLVSPETEEETALLYTKKNTSCINCEVLKVSESVKYQSGLDETLHVNVGDRIILTDPYRITLEDDMFSEFSDQTHYVIQRREIAYIYPSTD